MAAAEPIRISPADSEQPKMAELYRMLVHSGKAALIGPAPDCKKIDLPDSVYQTLLKVVETMQEGKAIAVMPLMQQMTTQSAANFLGVSRQFLVRELEGGKIHFHYVGTHRRIYLRDLLEYKETRMHDRRGSIERMARKAEELGDYDKFVPPDPE
jgi:excisionase family DNA binding protein